MRSRKSCSTKHLDDILCEADVTPEWKELLRDLDRLQNVRLEHRGTDWVVRTDATRNVAALFRHAHIGLPPRARQTAPPKAASSTSAHIRFTSSILPKWARRTKSLDALLPALYLRGISAGDFQEVLTALLGKDAPNLSPAVIARLKGEWEDEYQRWQKRDLSARRYVYVWADGVYLQARMEPQAECMLVLIGATPEGKKELIGFRTGMRESAQSWKELLVDLKARGLSIAPEVAVGDGALGFWKALDETFPSTRHQRCWLHKTLNVLDKFPKSMQPNAHKDLREIWLAPDRATAETAIAAFAEKYAPKYDKAVECLIKDRETLLTFFDFPADHWDHLRTTNPIESIFATVIRGPAPAQHRVRFHPAAGHERLGARENDHVSSKHLDASGGRRDGGA